MTNLLSSTVHTASKRLKTCRCSQCNRLIEPGQKYRRQAWKDGREFCTDIAHLECCLAAGQWFIEQGLRWQCDDMIHLTKEARDHAEELIPWLREYYPVVAERLA